MKVAICGSGPLGLEAAWHFHQLGASVTLFTRSELGGSLRRMAELFPKFPLNELGSMDSYWQNHLVPLVRKIEDSEIKLRGEVLRIHKRFLSLEEEVPGKSRLQDLFRVVYKMENSENFEDVDIIIDARGFYHNPLPLGPSNSLALNEGRIGKKDSVHYGLKAIKKIREEFKKGERCLLVGSGETTALILSHLKDWLFAEPQNKLTLVTSETEAFSQFFKTSKNEFLKDSLLSFIKQNETHWENQKREFESKLAEWRGLDEFVRVKMPKPQVPTPQVLLFEGYNISAIDQLEDREGLFVTCESSNFRKQEEQEEYVKTLGVDQVLVTTGYTLETNLLQGLRTHYTFDRKGAYSENGSHPEPGFYTLTGRSLDEGLKQIPILEKLILSFFIPQEKDL